MKKNINFLLVITFVNNVSQPALSLENSSYTYVKSNLEFLASDELEGREATTRGEKLASLYISEELEKYGVEPYGDSGGYFQNFNMMVTYYSPESKLSLSNNDTTINYLNGTEIVYSSRSLPADKYSGVEYGLVFAGYGIVSEEDDYDSYQNIDVNNKVVIILPGVPSNDTSNILSDRAIKKFRRSSTAKAEIAKLNGAAGLIILPNEESLRYWDYYQRGANRKSFQLEEEFTYSPNNAGIPIIYFNEKSSAELFEKEKSKLSNIKKGDNPYPETFSLTSKIKFEYNVHVENRTARNIIGIIRGNDAFPKGDYVTIGAHYDHVGIQGGKIYNGADDNGSGTVAILEVARKLAISNDNGRSVLVIFHTAEEKGLKGAKFLTRNSPFIDSTMVHINIDMVGRKSEDSIYCIGASKLSTQLGQMVEKVNSNTVNFVLDYKFDDPSDPQRLYYRSDHVHYANHGIPIVFFYDYMLKDYHKPTDTVDKINFIKIVKMTDLIHNLVIDLSNMNSKLVVNNPSESD